MAFESNFNFLELLHPTKEAPNDFRNWVNSVIQDWDFENVCAAHIGVRMGTEENIIIIILMFGQNKNDFCSVLIKIRKYL